MKLKKVLVALETKRTDFDHIWQDVKKVKKYASDLQTFIGVNEMTSVVDWEVKKQKWAFDYDIFELKLDFSSELESFVKDVSKFAVVSVTEKALSYQSCKRGWIASTYSTGKQDVCCDTTHKKDDCQFSNWG